MWLPRTTQLLWTRGGLGLSCCYHDDTQSEAAGIMLEEREEGNGEKGERGGRGDAVRLLMASGQTERTMEGGEMCYRERRRERFRGEERGI